MLRQRQTSLLCSLAQLWRGGSSTAAVASAGLAALQQPVATSSSGPAVWQALQLVSCRWFSAMPARQSAEREFIALNNIADNPGATHYVSGSDGALPAQGCPAGRAGGRRRRRHRAGAGSLPECPFPCTALPALLPAAQAGGPRHRLRPRQDFWPGAQGPESAVRWVLAGQPVSALFCECRHGQWPGPLACVLC